MAQFVDGVVQNNRTKTAATLTSEDKTPYDGEITIELDTGNVKIGDGVTSWTGLPYFAPGTVGEFKSFATYKDRTSNFLLPFDYNNAISTTTYATLFAEIGNVYETQHVAAGDPASGGSAFYPTPVPAAYSRIGIPDIVFVNTAVSSNLLTYSTPSGFRDGTIFRYELLTGTTITNLSSGTEYYLRRVSSTTLSIHTTEANAISNTSPIAIADGGTGTFRLTQEGVGITHAIEDHRQDMYNIEIADTGSGLVVFTPVSNPPQFTLGVDGVTANVSNETRASAFYEFKYIKYL